MPRTSLSPAFARAGAVAIAALVVLLGARSIHRAAATPEDAITYTVVQSPAAGAVLQVGSTVTFTIDVAGDGVTSPPAFGGPVVFDLKKPTNLSFQGYGQQSGNILTSCADNLPASGYVRCVVGAGSIAAGALQTGTAQEIVLNFTIDAAGAGTVYSTPVIEALFTDASSGFRNANDAADNANVGSGDMLDGSVGGFTVTNILGANANMTVSAAAGPADVYEGGLTTVTATFNHSLGSLSASASPIEVQVSNGDIQTGTISCPGGTGVASLVGNAARCTGSTVSDGSTISFQVRSADTATGDDMVALVVAPSLGLPQSEAQSAADGTARRIIPVREVGLQTVTLPAPGAAAPPWVVGGAITVCTASVSPDDANDAAAGLPQDPSMVAGTSTLSPVTPMADGDFSVAGPFGAVSFTYLASNALNCGIGQSGVQFATPFAGTYTVTVYYNGDITSGSTLGATRGSNVLSFSVQNSNPAPSLTSLSPASAAAGGPTFNLTVNGSNFVADSVVRWNGSDRVTTFVSTTQLTAAIPAGDVAAQGSGTVTVFSPTPGGGTSNALGFTITGAPNPAPLISTLVPASANAASPGFTITVFGSSFVPGAVVRWNGSDRITTFIGAGQLTAEVLTGDLAAPGSANVSVFNPAPGGGTSLVTTFNVASTPNPSPALASLSPSGAAVGGAAFMLTVTGSNFVPSSVIRWNGADRPTTYVSSGQLTASIPSGDLVSAGTATVRVFTPGPGGGLSSGVSFAIDNSFPAITALNPAPVTAGAASFTLTVNGAGFLAGSEVRWNGVARPTTYLSANQLTAAISAADIGVAGTAAVSVFNGPPGGGTSSPVSLTINNPAPTLTSLNPAGVNAASGALTLTVSGTGFVPGSVVRWDGADRTTTYVSATQLTAAITGADVLTTRTVSVTVLNPAPGGGTSPGVSFAIGTPILQTSNQLTLLAPGVAPIGRSRLAFVVSSGSTTPTSVTVILKRESDGKYWDPAAHAWIVAETATPAVKQADNSWKVAITGADRRSFTDTRVVVDVRAIVEGLPFRGAAMPVVVVR